MVKISYTKLRIILSEKNKFALQTVHPFQDSLLKVSQYRIMLTSILKTGGKTNPSHTITHPPPPQTIKHGRVRYRKLDFLFNPLSAGVALI